MCMKRMARSWDTNSSGISVNETFEANKSVNCSLELTAISSGLVFLLVVIVMWVPVMWILCRCEKKSASAAAQEPAGKENNSDYRSFDDISGVDNQGFVDIDLREYQDLPSTSSGIYHHKNDPQILNASALKDSFEMCEMDVKKSAPAKKTTILNHVSSFIKNAVGKARPDDKTVAVNTIYRPELEPNQNFKRSKSLPARFKKPKWATVRDVITLRAQVHEAEPKRDEASAFCCAVILKNLESQGYFNDSIPKIKITELREDNFRDESGTLEFSFRVQVSKFSKQTKQNGDNMLVVKKKNDSKENIMIVFEKDLSVPRTFDELATAVEELCGKSTPASVSVYGGTSTNTLSDQGIETQTDWNICLVGENADGEHSFEKPEAKPDNEDDVANV